MTTIKQPYQELFDYLAKELNVIALQTEMQEIEAIIVRKIELDKYFEETVIYAFNEGQALNLRGKLILGKEWYSQNKEVLMTKQLNIIALQTEMQEIEAIILKNNEQKDKILDFLYTEITERRDYSASKMCEEVIKFIQQLK